MLYDKLREYARSGVYPFHMPGHKRALSDGILPYSIDLTEIHGFDYLHDPVGCIREVEQKAQLLYNAGRAFLMVNGATGGILSAVRAMTKPGDTVIAARNCHKSVYNAIELCSLDPVYYIPGAFMHRDIFGSVDPAGFEALINSNPGATLAVITSPTYEGVCSDVEAIAKICHSHGVKLLVDEAHGAHFPFSERFPRPAIECGADVSVVSLHKTLPALTQTALLLTNDSALEPLLQEQLAVFESSSPSYVLMSSIESCLDYVSDNSFEEYISLLDYFYGKAKSLNRLRLLFDTESNDRNCFDYDIGKLVITAYNTNCSGVELARMLREDHQIETEMSSLNHVIAMTSVCDTREGFDRLFEALSAIDKKLKYSAEEKYPSASFVMPEKRFNPCDRFRYKPKAVAAEEAVGKASMEYVYAYPPGIPFLVPGEVIMRETVMQIKAMIKNGIAVSSTCGLLPRMISTAD